MPRHNEQKEANDSEITSDREIWSAIRYLDPKSAHRECDIAATVAIVAVIDLETLRSGAARVVLSHIQKGHRRSERTERPKTFDQHSTLCWPSVSDRTVHEE